MSTYAQTTFDDATVTRRVIQVAAGVACVLAPVTMLAGLESPLRTFAVLALFCLAPGTAVLSLVAPRRPALELGLVVATSLSGVAVLAQLLLWLGLWAPTTATYLLALVCLPPIGALAFPARPRARYGRVVADGRVRFQLARFTWSTPDRLELEGQFAGGETLTGDPFLVIRHGERTHRLPADPETVPEDPVDGRVWGASFVWQEPPVPFDSAELHIGDHVVAELPGPGAAHEHSAEAAVAAVQTIASDLHTAHEQLAAKEAALDEAQARIEDLAAARAEEQARHRAEVAALREELERACQDAASLRDRLQALRDASGD